MKYFKDSMVLLGKHSNFSYKTVSHFFLNAFSLIIFVVVSSHLQENARLLSWIVPLFFAFLDPESIIILCHNLKSLSSGTTEDCQINSLLRVPSCGPSKSVTKHPLATMERVG